MASRVTANRRSSAVFLLLAAALSSPARADTPVHLWSRGYGSTESDQGLSASATADGGALVTGAFRDTVDFGGGPLASAGGQDAFVLKLDSGGNHVWSHRYGSTGFDVGSCVVATADGGTLVTGSFQGTVDFGGGPLTSAGASDIFVVKLDSSGGHSWSRRYGDVNPDNGTSIAATPDGGALLMGDFFGTVDFGGGPLTSTNSDIFLLKLDSGGGHVWSRRYGGLSGDRGAGVSATADGGALVTGPLFDTVDFGGGPLTSAGGSDIFVLRVDSAGDHVWSRRYGGTASDIGNGVVASADGGVLVVGGFQGTVDFGGGPWTSAGNQDLFVLKLDSRGNHLWSRGYGSTGYDNGASIAATGDGGSLVTGSFSGTVDFGGGPLTSAGGSDVLVMQLDAGGNHVWSRRYGSTLFDTGYSVSATAGSGALVTGSFSGTVDFGGGPLTSAGAGDVFVLALGPDPTGVDPTAGEREAQLEVFPNPSTSSATFRLATPRSGLYGLSIYDVAGRRVRTFHDVTMTSGHVWTWDGRDGGGEPAGAGAYFYVLKGPNSTSTGKFVLVR